MRIKEAVCGAIGITGGFFSYLFGGFDHLATALFVVMVLDFLLGIMCGAIGVSPKTENGHLLSSVAVKGLAKKVYELALVAVGHQVDAVIGTAYFRDAIIIAFLAIEVLSIIENGGLLGIDIPAPVASMVELLNRKGVDSDDAEKR